MLEKYKHISFDLDGTLVHTMPEYRHKIVPEVVKELGGVIQNKFSIDKFWFESGRDEVVKNDFKLEPLLFWKLFHKKDSAASRSQHTRAYEDAEAALRRIKEMGKLVSIITGAPDWIFRMEIQKLNGAPCDLYLSIHHEKFNPKPDPESFFHALKKLTIQPNETVYVGNSNEDAYFAKNAGVDFIYLERKEHQFDLRDHAITTIHSLSELFGSFPYGEVMKFDVA